MFLHVRPRREEVGGDRLAQLAMRRIAEGIKSLPDLNLWELCNRAEQHFLFRFNQHVKARRYRRFFKAAVQDSLGSSFLPGATLFPQHRELAIDGSMG